MSTTSVRQRSRMTLACQQAMRAATEAVDTTFRLAGAGAVYSSHPLQRCFRDVHTVAQHVFYAPDSWRSYAQYMLGMPLGPPFN